MALDWNVIGKNIPSNRWEFKGDVARKFFCKFPLSMAWGAVEWKPYQSAQDRYLREKKTVQALMETELHTPELLDFDDEKLMLAFRRRELKDIDTVLLDAERTDKLAYLGEMFQLLKGIHGENTYHGDTYLKNFFLADRKVYTCDFELRRQSPFGKAIDVLLLTANAMSVLSKTEVNPLETLDVVEACYGPITKMPIGRMNERFLQARFGVGEVFLNEFRAR